MLKWNCGGTWAKKYGVTYYFVFKKLCFLSSCQSEHGWLQWGHLWNHIFVCILLGEIFTHQFYSHLFPKRRLNKPNLYYSLGGKDPWAGSFQESLICLACSTKETVGKTYSLLRFPSVVLPWSITCIPPIAQPTAGQRCCGTGMNASSEAIWFAVCSVPP